MTRTLDRRTALKAIGSGLAVGMVGASSATARSLENAPLDAQLDAVRGVTEGYDNLGGLKRAVADGFQIMGPYVPDMGWHLVNFDRIEDAAENGIDILRPQGLTYNLEQQLGSVEYIIPLDDDAPDVFNDETAADVKVSEDHGWHPHHGAQHVYATPEVEAPDDPSDNLQHASLEDKLNPAHWMELSDEHPVFPAEQPNLSVGDELTIDWLPFGENGSTRTVDGLITHDDWWTLHAWVHFENPHGVFAPVNHSERWDPFGGGHSH